MMIGVVGSPGTGKTMTMTYIGLKYFTQGKTLYSNYKLQDQDNREISTLIKAEKDFALMKNGVFLGDELWKWNDARELKGGKKKFVNDSLLVFRKRGIKEVVYTTQNINQIDKRVRENTDYIVIPVLSIIYNNRKVRIHQSILKPVNYDKYLRYMYIDAFVFDVMGELTEKFSFQVNPLAEFYNTKEEIELLQ